MRPNPAAFVLCLIALTSALRAAEWTEPADGRFTEQQMQAYLDCTRQWLKLNQNAGQATQDVSGWGAMAIAAQTNEQFRRILKDHGLSDQQWTWLGRQTWDAWQHVALEEMSVKIKTNLASSRRQNQDALQQAQAELKQYEQAQKDGVRVLSDEQRQAAIASANEQIKSLSDQIAEYELAAGTAAEQAAQQEQAAQKADALAAHPPPQIVPDDREGYISDQKTQADNARESARSLRQTEAEQRQQIAEVSGKLQLAQATAARPQVPQTDDQKAQARLENENAIRQAKLQIEQAQDALKIMDEAQETLLKQLSDGLKPVPAENIELLKKHLREFADVWHLELPEATTQP